MTFAQAFQLPIVLSDDVGMLLRLVAAHDGLSEHQFIGRAVIARAEAIGIGPLLDASEMRDRAAEARLAHNQEVDGSNPSPATISGPHGRRPPVGGSAEGRDTHNRESPSRGGKACHREPSRCLGPP